VPTSDRIRLIAAGVDGHPEGRDAAALATRVAHVAGAGVILVAVVGGPGRTEEAALARLGMLTAFMARDARIAIETDRSVPRALARVVSRAHPDLLVLGSSRHGRKGKVRIGRCTRQLLREGQCALAVAPRGLSTRGHWPLTVIGAGYDGTPEAGSALTRAGALARDIGAMVRVRAVVDDRLPSTGWTPTGGPDPGEIWGEVIEPRARSLREAAERAVAEIDAETIVEVRAGSPPEELLALSREVDLMVIGSRRWGTATRVLLGSVGEALMHEAPCPVLVIPPITQNA
jgi:nucleotide-binding universal stress UspA family protein